MTGQAFGDGLASMVGGEVRPHTIVVEEETTSMDVAPPGESVRVNRTFALLTGADERGARAARRPWGKLLQWGRELLQ